MQLTIQPNYYSKSIPSKTQQNNSTTSNTIYSGKYSQGMISFKGEKEVFEYQTRFEKNLETMGWFRKYFLGGRKNAEHITNLELIAFRQKQCGQRERDISTREEDLRKREAASNARIKAHDENINSREQAMQSKEIDFQARYTQAQDGLRTQINDCNTKVHKALEDCNTRIATREQAMLKAEDACNARISERRQAISTAENECEDRMKEREQAITTAEKESEDRIRGKAEAVNRRHADAIQTRNEGIQMKEEALQIRDNAINAKKDAFRLKEEALQAEGNSMVSVYDFSNSKKKELLEKRLQTLEEKEAFLDELEKQAKNDKKKADAELAKLRKEVEALKAELLGIIPPSSEVEEASKSLQSDRILRLMEEDANRKTGFNRIAGYQEQKDYLAKYFVSPVALEKEGKLTEEVPDGILFFGPKGTGKSTFTQALAEQTKSRLVEIEDSVNEPENLERLKRAANEAKALFEKDGTRTILHITELSDFVPKNSRILKPFNELMGTLSKDYHATLVAATRSLEGVDDKLLKSKLFYKIVLPPANKEALTSLLEYYAKPYADTDIDYAELAESITTRQRNQAFSNARIRKAIHELTISEEFSGKLTQETLLEAIKTLSPDIKKETLGLFQQQIERLNMIKIMQGVTQRFKIK